VVFAVNAFLGGFIQIYSGRLGDLFGYKRTLILFSFGSFVSYFLLFVSSRYYASAILFIPLFVINNLMSSLYQPSSNALLSLSSDLPLSGFSIMRVASNLGWSFGPAIGGIIISSFGYSDLFLIASGTSFIAFARYFILTDIKPKGKTPTRFSFKNIERSLYLLGAGTVFLFVVVSQFSVTLSLYANHIAGLGTASIGLIYFVNGIVVVLFQFPVYALIKKMGMWNGMIVGTLLYMIGYFSIAFDRVLNEFFISMFVITMGENFVTPTGNALVSDISGGRTLGTYMGVYNFFNSFGRGMAPAYGTLLLTYLINPYEIWGLAVFPAAIASVIFLSLKLRENRLKSAIPAPPISIEK
jgi:MFS family permease